MSPEPATFWSTLGRWGTNLAIVVLLVLLFLDAFPFVPPRIQESIQPVMKFSGLGQGQWNLFAPTPDSVNSRLRAEIIYADGQHVTWRSPEWATKLAWERFVSNRRLEYYDSLPHSYNSVAWPSFLEYLARTERPEGCTAKVRRVELWIEEALVPDPEEAGWPAWSYPPYGPPTLLYDFNHP